MPINPSGSRAFRSVASLVAQRNALSQRLFLQPAATFARGTHSPRQPSTTGRAMSKIMPLVLALVPLAAVVGAVVTVP